MNRGGNFRNDPQNARSANRNRNHPGNRNSNQGFWLVRASAPSPRLRRERDLRLKHPDARVLSCAGTLEALGARVRRDHITPGRKVHVRLGRRVRVRARSSGSLREAAFRRSVDASLGALLR